MVLAWVVVALCLTQSISPSHWGEVVISRAVYADSRRRRFTRWLTNERIHPAAYYRPLFGAALVHWEATDTIYLALDTSLLPDGYVLIRVSQIYRGRAIPVAWRVMELPSATVSYADYKGVLQQALAALPQDARVGLLADRGFLHAKLVRFCKRHGWHYRLRAKASTRGRLPEGQVVPPVKLCPPQGHVHFYYGRYILGEGLVGPVNLALANPEDTDEPWYIVSDDPTDVSTLDEYALRFDIEENFLDDKSNGFQVESCRLDDAQAIERLFLILAVATLHFTSVGAGVVKLEARRWVDTHWDRGMSYLKIGWSWLRQLFRRGWPNLPPLWLDLAPDPEPAIASRRQAAQPKRQWVVACFGVP